MSIRKKAWKISAGVHGVFFLILAVMALVQLWSRRSVQDDFVFELVATEPSEFSAATSDPSAVVTTKIRVPDLPAFSIQRHPEVVVTEPRVAVSATVPSEPAKQVAQPAARQPQKTVTFEQFQSQHGRVDSNPVHPPEKKVKINAPRIKTPHYAPQEGTATQLPAVAPSASISAAYRARLKQNANLAWSRPKISSSERLEASMLYTINASGLIESVQFETRSGNALLDNSVMTAAQNTQSPGPPPSGQRVVIRIRFALD